jgi:hypothetical protein
MSVALSMSPSGPANPPPRRRRRAGVRLSRPSFRVFSGRREHSCNAHQERLSVDLAGVFGRDRDTVAAAWRGHSFVAMTADLLAARSAPLPELDHVLLAYDTPELHVGEAVGGYLADRCPGNPQALAIAEQGAGAPFTALRVAGSMCRFGALDRALLFVLDQTTPLYDGAAAEGSRRDAGVLIDIGGDGELALVESAQVRTATPESVIIRLRTRYPELPVVLGTALAATLPRSVLTGRGVLVAAQDLTVSGAWIALAANWPATGGVLLADYDQFAGVVYTARLDPVDPELPEGTPRCVP